MSLLVEVQAAEIEQPLPPLIEHIELTKEGDLRLSISGAPNESYLVEATENLEDWTSVGAANRERIQTEFSFRASLASGRRFFRVRNSVTIEIALATRGWTSTMSPDGRKIVYPVEWVTRTGPDNRTIAFPPQWATSFGQDGRMIAFPSNWITYQGNDGRLVASRAANGVPTQGQDGRISRRAPDDGTSHQGADGRIFETPIGWIYLSGADGRSIPYREYLDLIRTGSDGRLISVPTNPAWRTAQGSDGRLVKFPKSGWSIAEGENGRAISFPSSWKSVQGIDGMMVAIPESTGSTLSLSFQDESSVRILKDASSPAEFVDLVLYHYFGTGEQGQSD